MVLSFCNQKGGCAKSTTVQALGEILTSRGYSVLCIDADGQGDLTAKVEIEDLKGDFFDLLTGSHAPDIVSRSNIFDIIAGSPSTFAINDPQTVADDPGALLAHDTLKKALEPIRGEYDFILIDSPPSLGDVQKMALVASDGVIIPAECDTASLNAVIATDETIEAVKSVNPSLNALGVVITRFDGRATATRQIVDIFRDSLQGMGYRLFNTKIRNSIKVREASAMATPLLDHAKGTNTIKDYKAFTDELLEIIGG